MVTITESTEWIAPVTGWYKFQIKGAGGGGAGGNCMTTDAAYLAGGGAGGDGGKYIGFHKLKKNEIVSINIGVGGNGSGGVYSHSGNCATSSARAGGNTIVSIKGNEYVGYGGNGGYSNCTGSSGGMGGAGSTFNGLHGDGGTTWHNVVRGSGTASPGYSNTSQYGSGGSGGSGGHDGYTCLVYPGEKGKDGAVIIEYHDKI